MSVVVSRVENRYLSRSVNSFLEFSYLLSRTYSQGVHKGFQKDRFSQLGTQICGKSSFSIKRSVNCASCRSVFCLRTRFALISAASPIPQLTLQLGELLFQPAPMPARFHPHTNLHPCAARSR